MERISNIINNNSSVVEDIELVRDYFYDQWDLKLVFNGEILLIDVKSAMTLKIQLNGGIFYILRFKLIRKVKMVQF